ncbi:hypothetical protein [Candidatus Enterovibrio escicola]|uniref:Mobile element protein n=1 Tax=Candidatus Enterovibrio escicola TaxID=1927127 RepID=A0A2A5T3D9_9GAMM|nr:hypothetical protein [Candidatus Enterovibrio escacola]PCS22661.1 Mobile element protein [Candidatus Enterovibrio escacola]
MLSPKLTLRDYNALVGETLANMAAINEVIRVSIPVRQQIN